MMSFEKTHGSRLINDQRNINDNYNAYTSYLKNIVRNAALEICMTSRVRSFPSLQVSLMEVHQVRRIHLAMCQLTFNIYPLIHSLPMDVYAIFMLIRAMTLGVKQFEKFNRSPDFYLYLMEEVRSKIPHHRIVNKKVKFFVAQRHRALNNFQSKSAINAYCILVVIGI